MRRYWRQIAIAAFVILLLVAVTWYTLENPVSQTFGPTITQVPLHEKYIALTFDDGPNPPYTNEIVEYLHRQHVPATFFVVGMAVEKHPDVVRQEVAYGNALGNHSWSHAHLVLERRAHIRSQLEKTDAAIVQATGVHTRLFRPPFGARDFAVLDTARSMGYQIIMWSVPLPRDWTNPPPQVIAQRVLRHIGDGAIIVLHDGNRGLPGDRSNTVEATKIIVTALKREGYHFVTVPQLLQLRYKKPPPVVPNEGETAMPAGGS